MFQNLSERLAKTLKNITGQGRLTESNIADTLRDIRVALLEADVALPVVKDFLEHIKERALGQEVMASLNPGQVLVKIVNDELIAILGKNTAELDLKTTPPAVILMAGLQGSGKTTSVAKLAKYLQEQQQKKVAVVSADIYRPAAIEQLGMLASQIGATFIPSQASQTPLEIVHNALETARKQFQDVLIIDTAGRLHVDADMMTEIKALHAATNPIETLFVVDSMTGQDAANTAKAFADALPLTGIILTKIDGDARGGAALSISHITGKPIKFLGQGEKVDALEVFHPDRIASRILGMGDIVSLVEEVARKVDVKEAEKARKKLQKGSFDLDDFRNQLAQMQNMGGISGLLTKIPGLGNMSNVAEEHLNNKSTNRIIAIINSMTRKERRFPHLIDGSRKRRIAVGSGTDIPAVNRLLKQFKMMQKTMKKFSKPGAMSKMMRTFGGLGGMMPPREK
jgi:signal recognition particle subunit SRP54